MVTMRRRQGRPKGPTEAEWLWLTAGRGYNPFLGFVSKRDGPSRLDRLWEEFEAEIRREWGAKPPGDLPFGHPAARDGGR